ncbi:MAG TPA: substrate-binding domain-containing protein [Bryobacteraceae bacterium]|nr:substrate-binding domain-containing protein [Bryobacteraceae bacterium]
MPQAADPYYIEAAARMLDVLDLFREGTRELTLADVSKRCGLVKSTAFRMLYTLEKKGYIERVANSRTYRRRERYRVGFASISTTIPFAVDINRGIQTEARRNGIELLIKNNEFDPEATVRNVEELIESGVKLIIVYNSDERISHVIADRCAGANVPVVAITFPVPGAATVFGVNNYRAGLTGGEALGAHVARAWQGRLDRVVLLDIQGSSPAQQARLTGMLEGMRKRVNVPAGAVLHLHTEYKRRTAENLMQQFLARNPSLRRIVVLSYNDENALRAAEAIRDAGRCPHVLMLSQGGVAAVRAEMARRGTCFWGAVAHYPERFGTGLLPVVVRILRGETVPNAIWTPHALITRADL